MVSKGIRAYTWIGVPGCKVVYSVPKNTITREQEQTWSNDLLEVDSHNLPFNVWTGPFTFTAYDPQGNEITTGKNMISSWDGNIEDGSTFASLPQMASVVSPEIIVTYGFYDAGSGVAGLPNTDQCWVTITPNRAGWMGTIAAPNSTQASKSFNTLVLPSPHDVGMNNTDNIMALFGDSKNDAVIISLMVAIMLTFPVVGAALAGIGGVVLAANKENIVTALAFTQKDTLTTMLQTGARYFEFRPAHVSSLFPSNASLGKKLYFTHLVIPGQAFDSWLTEAVDFLVQNPTEIIVVQIRGDGIDSTCARATNQEIDT